MLPLQERPAVFEEELEQVQELSALAALQEQQALLEV